MNYPKVDFATFCYEKDMHRLYAPGQLQKQVWSNNYDFNSIIVVHQLCYPDYSKLPFFDFSINALIIEDVDAVLKDYIDLDKPQYVSSTDKLHQYKGHVVNHLVAAERSKADYIVFADNDCWMVRQPEGRSWIDLGIELLELNPSIFIVSPNDGESERPTKRFSQQMFLARADEFRNANFNQPGWDGNVNVPGGPLPEYWAMLEGRMELYCRTTGQFRYVLGPEYRYWHFRLLTEDGYFETDLGKY